MKVRNLTDLFIHQLNDIYGAEHQLSAALPDMAARARNAELKKTIENHAVETERHITRIGEILDILGITPKKGACETMASLIHEGRAMLAEANDAHVIDAALIASAQKIEHHEIATYGTLIALARTLGYDNAVVILKETLAEEKTTDEALTHLAMDAGINEMALKKAA